MVWFNAKSEKVVINFTPVVKVSRLKSFLDFGNFSTFLIKII